MLDFARQIDWAVAGWLVGERNDFLNGFFLTVTAFGKSYAVAGIALFFIFFWWKKGPRECVFGLLVSIGGSAITVYVLKALIGRSRPAVALFQENMDSFPSGHAAAAVAFYGFLVCIFLENIFQPLYRALFLFFGALLIILIGFSRLYLGVHYLSDVLAGYFVGAVWLGIVLSALRKQKNVV